MEEKTQFVTLPNSLVENEEVCAKALVVYCAIKKFMNLETLQCYPSNATIAEICGCGETAVKSHIKELEKAGYIKVERRVGKSNVYTFVPHKNFEPFSYDFLDNKNLKLREKAYLVAQQKNMFINEVTKIGTVSYSTSEIAELTKMSEPTVLACEKVLMQQGLMAKVPSLRIDKQSGTKEQIRKFFLEMYNVISYAYKQTQKNTEDIEFLKKENEMLRKEIEMLKREVFKGQEIPEIILD